MSVSAMSLKARIRNYAREHNIAAQVVLQNYMFERFLARLSESEYCEKFVIKGGMLITAIVGLDTRTTMDLDTTLKNLPLTESTVIKAVENICAVDLGDDVMFKLISIDTIRKDDEYGGFRVRIDAVFDTIVIPFSLDISTGDVITPAAIQYEFGSVFDDEVRIRLWGYNIETVMAEKMETILRRGIYNTRPRDYYDIYILEATQQYDKKLFKAALEAMAKHRGSSENLENGETVIHLISENKELQNTWMKYQNKFSYAESISYEDIIKVLFKLIM